MDSELSEIGIDFLMGTKYIQKKCFMSFWQQLRVFCTKYRLSLKENL